MQLGAKFVDQGARFIATNPDTHGLMYARPAARIAPHRANDRQKAVLRGQTERTGIIPRRPEPGWRPLRQHHHHRRRQPAHRHLAAGFGPVSDSSGALRVKTRWRTSTACRFDRTIFDSVVDIDIV